MLSFVVPCFRAARTIDHNIEELLAFLEGRGEQFELILVDDGSPDDTLARVQAWQHKDSRVRALSLTPNQGKGAAVKAGVLASQGDWVIFTDADLPYDLAAVDDAKRALEAGAQVVLGARYRESDDVLPEQKTHRTLLSRLFVFFANRALTYPVPDTQAGFKAFQGDAARSLFARVTIPRFCFDVEVIALAQRAGMVITNIPVHLVQQDTSSVKVLRDGVDMCLDLLHIYVDKLDIISWKTIKQFFSYGAVGILNTLLNFGIINAAMYATGITRGPRFLLISLGSFCIVVFHSFLWNRYLVFRHDSKKKAHHEYVAFFTMTSITALISLYVLHIIVDIIGAPVGIGEHLWANIALCITIPLSVVCNFFGYKFFVFAERNSR